MVIRCDIAGFSFETTLDLFLMDNPNLESLRPDLEVDLECVGFKTMLESDSNQGVLMVLTRLEG